MLRIIVITLVLLNLLLLGFQTSRPGRTAETEPAAASEVVEDGDIPTIHLFSEMIRDQKLMSGNRQCFSLGPFDSAGDRDQLRQQLRGIVTGISERQTQATVERGYWVFLPPAASLLEANRLLLSVKALGIEDSSVIYDGEWENAISLGYFRRQGNANRRVRELEGRGYEPQIQVRRQVEPRYWLDYEQGPGVELLVLDVPDRLPGMVQRVLPCPELGFFSDLDTGVGEEADSPDSTPVAEYGEIAGNGSG